VEGAGSKIVEIRGHGAILVAAIPGLEAASHRRGTRTGGRQWRPLASACGGRWLEYGNARVHEARMWGRLPRWWHGRLAQRLAGDASVAQGAEAVVERDCDLGAHDGE
jgi:hypothetical protein